MRPETARKQKRFLAALIRHGGNITAAAAAIGHTGEIHHNWIKRRARFPEYRAQFAKARRKADRVRRQKYKDVIQDRGIKGRFQYIKNKDGGLQSYPWSDATGFVDFQDERYTSNPDNFKLRTLGEYIPSDNLLMFEAKKMMPKYREKNQIALTGADGGPIETKSAKEMSDDELRRIAIAGRN